MFEMRYGRRTFSPEFEPRFKIVAMILEQGMSVRQGGAATTTDSIRLWTTPAWSSTKEPAPTPRRRRNRPLPQTGSTPFSEKGKVRALVDKIEAEGEHEEFRRKQDTDHLSDFDCIIEEARCLEGEEESKTLGRGQGR